MKPDVKEKWLKALRSNDFQQGEELLRTDDNCYCCLGVLGAVLDSARWEEGDHEDSDSGKIVRWAWDGETGMLSDRALAEIGLNKEVALKLAIMNDNGKSFETIADYIEAKV